MRQAREEDAPAIEILIRVSVRVLQSSRYSEAQIEGAIGSVFGLDQQLLWDGTYFVAERKGQIVGCGGWSRRTTLFGAIPRESARSSFIQLGRVVASA